MAVWMADHDNKETGGKIMIILYCLKRNGELLLDYTGMTEKDVAMKAKDNFTNFDSIWHEFSIVKIKIYEIKS